MRAPSFDTQSALDQLRARDDTGAQSFVVVYVDGPTNDDLAQFRAWDAHAYFPRQGEPWLEVRITVNQAVVVATSVRVDRVVPGSLVVACPA